MRVWRGFRRTFCKRDASNENFNKVFVFQSVMKESPTKIMKKTPYQNRSGGRHSKLNRATEQQARGGPAAKQAKILLPSDDNRATQPI
jgi:hypothetical protein